MEFALSAFPDLEAALTISRVEVVSNVEIETIKTALRWLFDEAKSRRNASCALDAPGIQKEIADISKLGQEQAASIKALQDQQVLQSSSDATYAAVYVALRPAFSSIFIVL